MTELRVVAGEGESIETRFHVLLPEDFSSEAFVSLDGSMDEKTLIPVRRVAPNSLHMVTDPVLIHTGTNKSYRYAFRSWLKKTLSVITNSTEDMKTEELARDIVVCAHQFAFSLHVPKLDVEFEPAVYLTHYFLYILREAANQDANTALNLLTNFMDVFLGEFSGTISSTKMIYLIEETINAGVSATQCVLITSFFGYITHELPPSFPTAPLLNCFVELPAKLTNFNKQHLRQSFKQLFVHNMINSAGAEWRMYLPQMATRDKSFAFLKAVVGQLPTVQKGVLWDAWANTSLSSIQRNALVSHLIPNGFGDLEDVVDVFIAADDSYVQMVCKQRIARALQNTPFSTWEHLLQKIGKPVKRAQIEEDAKNIKKSIMKKFEFVKQKIGKKEEAPTKLSKTEPTTKVAATTPTKKSTKEEPTTDDKDKDTKKTKTTVKKVVKASKDSNEVKADSKDATEKATTEKKVVKKTVKSKQAKEAVTPKPTEGATSAAQAEEPKLKKVVKAKAPKDAEVPAKVNGEIKATKVAEEPARQENEDEEVGVAEKEEAKSAEDKEDELNKKRFVMAETFRDALFQLVAKNTRVREDQEASFCRIIIEYALLENEQFEEPLRYLLETRRPSFLLAFVDILGRSHMKEVTVVNELSKEWFYIMLEQKLTPLVIYQILFRILPSIHRYPHVFDNLSRVAGERLETTGPKMVIQQANAIAKLQGEHSDFIQKAFLAAAVPIIEKGVSSMSSVRDIVVSVGSDGVQDVITSSLLVTLLDAMGALNTDDKNRPPIIAVIDSNDAWYSILALTGANTAPILAHTLTQQATHAVKSTAESISAIDANSIPLSLLAQVLALDQNEVLRYFKLLSCEQHFLMLTRAAEKVELYNAQLKHLREFLQQFCSIAKATDLLKYEDDFERKCKDSNILLRTIFTEDHWGIHKPYLDLAKRLFIFAGSQTFANIFRRTCTNYAKSVDVASIGHLADFSMNAYRKDCDEYYIIYKPPTTIENVEAMWENVSPDRVDEELSVISKYMEKPIPPEVPSLIQIYTQLPSMVLKAQHITQMMEILYLQEDATYQSFVDYPKFKDMKTLTLKKLEESTNNIFCHVKEYVDADWAFVEALSRAKDLVTFLKQVLNEDLRNLIDAVEMHSDQFIRESTVSDLIDVKSFFQGVLKKRLSGADFLALLHVGLTRDTNLAAKVHVCNENIRGLERLYANVANRSEVTKEIIANALKLGVIEFTAEVVTLTYTANVLATYTLPDLVELRSRALLVANLAKGTQFKKVVIPSSPDDPHVNQISEQEAAANVTEFVKLVDLAQGIADMLQQLKRLGHFLYQKQAITVNLGLDLVSGRGAVSQLTALYEELHAKLKEWEDILSKSRRLHYLLTYLNASQLLLLRSFLDGTLEDGMKPHLRSALVFIDPFGNDVALTVPTPFSPVSEDLMARVSEVGGYLDQVFRKKPPFSRPIKNKPDESITPEVKSREIFVASVSDKVFIIPALMSLFARTGLFPEPHQVLFCHTGTQWEELNLILLRCFFAHDNGLDKSLYCIANIEFLDFGLQSQLARTIQALHAQTTSPYYLGLVVNRESSEQHILDKFTEFVHPLEVPPDIVRPVIRSVFKNDTYVVTAELAGIGKSETISQMAYTEKKRPVHFPVSGPITRHALISRLCSVALDSNTECLHLDIGVVDDPNMINTFLFELLVIGSVSSGVLFCYCPKSSVFIEIANTINNDLVNRLPMCNNFFKLSLQWSPSKVIASRIVTSPIQVVCNYLLALDTFTLASKDLVFSPPAKCNVEALSSQRCAQLLDKFFFKDTPNLSFSILNIFLNFFSAQLIKFTQSQFFMVGNLIAMGAKGGLRGELVAALMHVSEDFSHRSAGVVRKSQTTELKGTAEDAVSRLEGMIQWEQSNHLLVIFHSQDPHTISALYRDKSLVPTGITDLLKSQSSVPNWQLDDYATMTHAELLQKLERIVRTTFEPQTYPTYALTSDNFLKMALIVLRIRARIPVVVMGETGCGKTSLVKFLSIVAGVDFTHMDFHSGITETHIIDFVKKQQQLAFANPHKSFWMFLDEINTCDHLGLISELICHRSMLGVPLPLNLCLIAACNPYRLRTKQTQTSGLDGKIKWDDLSKLVYRVHPLPESLMDYVWDYGTLAAVDEKMYIATIVATTFANVPIDVINMMVEAIYFSQRYIRKVESPESVSLRDVKRCKTLMLWFSKHLKSDTSNEKERQKRSIVLGLAHCYYCRLCTTYEREHYRTEITKVFRHGPIDLSLGTDEFENILLAEQTGYLNDMELPEGIAPNTALLENVFVVLVCILNKIPVFVVGKPGCSKSLSLQLINSNLRGIDSKSSFFQKLPQVFVIAYQGSESSTSDGILKVFAKAHKYVEHNKGVIPVVLLDEVGLAEISKYNPLKVLHGLLEPAYPKESLDVAVVGISNWALDSAKMNRAIHLSRPEPDVSDLCATGKAIQKMIAGNNSTINHSRMYALAAAYHKYINSQTHSNFHGLRDYYSLIKCLSQDSGDEMSTLIYALERNFGGLPGEMSMILQNFLVQTPTFQHTPTPVLELIRGNLVDRTARHLMVISSGDSVVGILERYLIEEDSGASSKKGRKFKHKKQSEPALPPFVIFGSKFQEDRSEEYRYRVLSKIILCMETGRTIILKDLEDIYGSLYDMLNQNYTYVGKKKNCRIALGAYSNPMCNVSNDFRCIVLVDRLKVDFTDPPFLNRFEKQMILYEDILDKSNMAVLASVKNWVTEISNVSGFTEQDMFVGFTEDTLSSLALLYSNESSADAIENIKNELIWIATPDGIVRARNSQQEFKKYYDSYFEEQVHDSLPSFLQSIKSSTSGARSWDDANGMKVALMTHSNIHTNLSTLISPTFAKHAHQVFRLGTFTSEKQLTNTIQNFFADSSLMLFALQCDTQIDAPHILLAKYILDQVRAEYLEQFRSTEGDFATPGAPPRKHLLLIFHVQRGSSSSERWQLNYQSGWNQITIDTLEPSVALPVILTQSLYEVVTSTVFSLEKGVTTALLSLPAHYSEGGSKKFEQPSQSLLALLCTAVRDWYSKHEGKGWLSIVANDNSKLCQQNSFIAAALQFVHTSVASTVAQFVTGLESEIDAFQSLAVPMQDLWLQGFNMIANMPIASRPKNTKKFKLPFSWLFISQLETLKNEFLEDTLRLEQILESEEEELEEGHKENGSGPLSEEVKERNRRQKLLQVENEQTDRFRGKSDAVIDKATSSILHRYLFQFSADYAQIMPLEISQNVHADVFLMNHAADVAIWWWRREISETRRLAKEALEREAVLHLYEVPSAEEPSAPPESLLEQATADEPETESEGEEEAEEGDEDDDSEEEEQQEVADEEQHQQEAEQLQGGEQQTQQEELESN